MNDTVIADVAIAGAGIIGLSLALELRERGVSVAVVERGQAMGSASWAAGGMLAVNDPQNPPELMPLCARSGELYPSYLDRIESLSNLRVPVRTHRALQEVKSGHDSRDAATAAEIAEFGPGLDPDGLNLKWLEEASIDPHDLHKALPTALIAIGGTLLEQTKVLGIQADGDCVRLQTERQRVSAGIFVNCCGAWAGDPRWGGAPVEPVKGHMANLRCEALRLRCVVRTAAVYLIPRGDGRVTVGSTIEHVGFDESVQEAKIGEIFDRARRLLPEATVPSPRDAWTGLRPGTPDGLPILGPAKTRNCWHATGHYRDGILLAPATARVMAQAILGETPDVPLDAFNAARFDVHY